MMRRKPLVFSVLGFLIIGVWITFFVFRVVFTPPRLNQDNRDALAKIHSAIDIGDTRSQVLRDYYDNRTVMLRLLADYPDEWVIRMPMELGASDWTVKIDFDQEKVTSVRIRTMDGPKPNIGPEDKNTQQEASPRTRSPERRREP